MNEALVAALMGMATREVTGVEDVTDGTLVTTHDGNTWHIATDEDGEPLRHAGGLLAGQPIVTLYAGPAADPKLHPENLRVGLYTGTARPGEGRKPRRLAKSQA